MGQAKRRGTFKERRDKAISEQERFFAGMEAPVDTETFKFAFEVWKNAAVMKMPTQNPESRLRIIDEEAGKEYVLADNHWNRAGPAVADQLREAGVANRQAYIARLMHLSQAYSERDGRLARFFKNAENGEVLVADALIEAVAAARFVVRRDDSAEGGYMGFDMDDLVEKAIAILDAEEQGENT